MSFASNHSEIVKLNNYNLRDLGGTASFEASAISGRGLPPTRERELQFPGEMGSRDYGSYYGNRRIEVSGMLYADSINDFRAGLNKIKELCRLRTFVDGILYEQVEAQMLWFADESVVAGPYTLTAHSKIGPASSIFDAPDAIGNYPSAYSSDDDLIGFDLEFANRGATAAPTKYTINSDGNVVSTGRFFCSPYYDSASPPTVGDTFWVVDNRYYLVNYSGTMNEERLTAQWFKTGYSRLTLPFKAVYPFAVSDPKKVDFTPNATNGYFKSLNTGNAISYPVYKVKGAASTPQIVEATHSLVWNANDNNATNILGESVSATVSAAGFYGQTGKLNQAIAFDANQDRTKSDFIDITNIETRDNMGIGSAINLNQGTVAFWFKKSGDYGPLEEQDTEFFFSTSNLMVYRYAPANDPATNRLYFNVSDQYIYANVGTNLTAGNWYFLCARWDVRRNDVNSSFYAYLKVFDTSGSEIMAASMGGNPTDPTGIGNIRLAEHVSVSGRVFDGLIDDLAIWDRPLTNTEESTLVNSGTGVRADTVASSELVYYSDFDQTVGTTFDATQIASSNMDTAQVSATTTTTATVAGYGDKIFPGTERFVLYDETGYKVQSTVATSADTSITYATLTDADKVGVYATLNGSNQYFSVAAPTGIDHSTDYSVSLWIKTTSSENDIIVNKKGTGNGLVVTKEPGGAIRGELHNTGGGWYQTQSSTLTVNDGKWHCVGFTYEHSTTTMTVYIDGLADGSNSATSGTMDTGAGAFYLGQYWAGSYLYNGSVRDVSVWPSLLTAGDMLSLATGPQTEVASPASWWKLTDASFSSTANDDASAGNNNDLTAYNSPTRTQLAYISKNLIADGGFENGGIGGWYPAAYQTGQKSTSVGKKDALSLQQLNTGGTTQTSVPGGIAAAAGEDYVLRGWTYGGNTLISSSGAFAYFNGTIMTQGQAGITANTWTHFETCFEAAATFSDIRFYSSTSTATESSYLDDLKLLPNLVNNGGMEGTYVAGLAPDWLVNGTTTTVESADEHSGAKAQQFTPGNSPTNCLRIAGTSLGMLANNTYELSFWAKITVGSGPIVWNFQDFAGLTNYSFTPSASYQRFSVVLNLGADVGGSVYIYGDGASTFILDDVSLVHRPDLSVSFNNMTNGYRFEPTRLTRGYKAGANEQSYFAGQTFNSKDYTARLILRPQFPSSTSENQFVFLAAHTNYFRLYFEASTDKFVFHRKDTGVSYYARSPVMNFAQDEEIEIGFSFNTVDGMKVYVNGSNVGGTNSATTTAVREVLDFDVYIGHPGSWGVPSSYIIDDLEILAKSQPAEWFAEKYAKRNEAKNLNLPFKYSATLSAGDILTINALDPKVRGRVEMYYASSGETQNQMGVSNVAGSMMPILSPTKSMLYFPNSIPSGVEIYYRENHQ
jgi:hypothetical protein